MKRQTTVQIDLRPILVTLARSRTGAILVAIQIAIALALVANAVYIAKQRVDKIARPTGMDVENIFLVSTAGFTDRFHLLPTIESDLHYLRGIPGVVAATTIDAIPLYENRGIGLAPRPGDRVVPVISGSFDIDEQGLKALGVKLTAGQNFRPDEIGLSQGNAVGPPPQLIITRHLAEKLFPGVNAIGRNVYMGSPTPARIVGVVDRMFSSSLNTDWLNDVTLEPRRPFVTASESYYYLVRTEAGQRDRIMRIAEETLSNSNPDRVVDWVQPLIHFKRVSYAFDTLVAGFLSFVTCILVCLAALGIFGLATFNVTSRFKQIGTRRAVGARRADILRYFLVENALVTAGGVLAGCLLALGIGYWLSVENQLPRLDLYYLVGGIAVLFIVGQLAAWHPARRAAAVPPSVATRTV